MPNMPEQNPEPKNEPGRFQVTEIYYLTDRGAFLVGHMLGGKINLGMRLKRGNNTFTISGIEYLDNLREKKFWNGILFKEKPTKAELEALFTIGEIIEDFLQ